MAMFILGSIITIDTMVLEAMCGTVEPFMKEDSRME